MRALAPRQVFRPPQRHEDSTKSSSSYCRRASNGRRSRDSIRAINAIKRYQISFSYSDRDQLRPRVCVGFLFTRRWLTYYQLA